MKKGKVFLRSFYITLVVILCLGFGLFASAKAYENTILIKNGEYKKAIELSDGKLRFFDKEVILK
ncbi:MAG: hypothetical protein II802_02525 [Clostridia bacterium]|nr:hypothetical protein [Clostridia bacterium]